MKYIQLNEDNQFVKHLPNTVTLWDENNLCTPEALIKDGKAEQFGVVPLIEVSPPQFDAMTQEVIEAPPAQAGGVWTQQWEIQALSAEAVAANMQASAQALQREVIDSTQLRLDNFCRTRNYEGVLSACTYATSTIQKFAVEGQYAVRARDETWAALYQFLGEVQAGIRNAPRSFDDIEPLLPQLTWPDESN